MTRIKKTLVAVTLGALFLAVFGGSAYAATHHYVVTNDNVAGSNSVSVFEVTGISLTHVSTVPTGGDGLGGGYFAQVDQSIAPDGGNTCVFAGDAATSDIAAMKVIGTSPYLQVVNDYVSPDGDSGDDIGLGIAISGNYLYANYTATPSIGVWQIGAGCTLNFVTHITGTSGIYGGLIDGMTATPNGNYLIVGYGDGSIGSYAIGGGNISLIGQETITGTTVGGGAYAGSAIVSSNGNWAIFGDFSGSNNTQLDVASIGSNGVLAPTNTYGGTGSLGAGVDANGIQLSPNNQFIYVVDSLSGQETTVAFNATTGVVSYPHPCLTNLNGYNTDWVFASQVGVATTSGAGGGLYISEGFLNGDSYIALLEVNSTTGCATEAPNSPFVDTATGSLESISSYSH
jgi:hypothetical protein